MSTPGAHPTSGTSPTAVGEVERSAGEGGCLCGAVRYRFTLPPLWVAHCHCTLCRRAQGAGFVTWLGTAAGGFELIDDAGCLRNHRSSPGAKRSFCGRCGTPLFFESTRWPGELHITAGSVDPGIAAQLRPQAHVYWATHVPWIGELDDDLPRHEATGSS